MRNFSNQNSRGFTLVETLIAVSIFSISILGLFAILTQGTANTAYAKKKIIASYLAQEGIEYVRNFRDTTVLYTSNTALKWIQFRNPLNIARCNRPAGCYFDDTAVLYDDESQPMRDLDFSACGATCPELRYDSGSDKFGYVAGENSGFIRKINANFSGADEVEVTSTVFWTHAGQTYSVAFSETMFNWAE